MAIFVSYKSDDRRLVKMLIDALREVGLDIWWDQDIPNGVPWEEAIHRALDASSCVLVCWTGLSVDARMGAKVQVEAREGLERDKLIQVVLAEVQPPLFFRQFQAQDLSAWNGLTTANSFRQLAAALHSTAARRGDVESGRPPHRLLTSQNIRRVLSRSFARYYIPPVLAAFAVLAVVTASADGRAAVCDWNPLPLLCHQAYSPEQLPDDMGKIVRRTRDIAIEAEQTALRARESEALGRAAAVNAIALKTGTKIQETQYFVYAGEWTDGTATGYGSQRWKTASTGLGEEYFGQFHDWTRVMGVYIYPPIAANTGSIARYEGEWAPGPRMSKGNWNGRAIVRYRDGAVYTGQVKDGMRHGYGMLVKKTGERLEGIWHTDVVDPATAVTWKRNGQLLQAGERAVLPVNSIANQRQSGTSTSRWQLWPLTS